MPNQDKQKFHKIQEEHKAEYIGTDRNQPMGKKNSTFNGQGNTDQSPGATGRNV
ncbi:hypothetical protein [Neobacillus notoginsengisoli]|uniref:hypothetical protein n=1 Tax=Neobacillus notoginsengisoli TaxID=1578198 RepID=UPI0013143750|nr:hypothetical protein [Neobacillus notoginsengisoli]